MMKQQFSVNNLFTYGDEKVRPILIATELKCIMYDLGSKIKITELFHSKWRISNGGNIRLAYEQSCYQAQRIPQYSIHGNTDGYDHFPYKTNKQNKLRGP
jgi:hypothetical protein